jgi:hypothetical protein
VTIFLLCTIRQPTDNITGAQAHWTMLFSFFSRYRLSGQLQNRPFRPNRSSTRIFSCEAVDSMIPSSEKLLKVAPLAVFLASNQ